MNNNGKVMEKLTNKFKMDLNDVACDMVDMRVFKIEDIKQYGFNTEEAEVIQREISKR